MSHLMQKNITINEHSIIMPLIEVCADNEIQMQEFFESIEEDGKVLEDSNILKYFTPYTDTSLMT